MILSQKLVPESDLQSILNFINLEPIENTIVLLSKMPFELPNLPKSIQDPAIAEFLAKFYEISNDPPAHDDFAALFTPDGEYGMNGKKAKGHDG